MGRTRLQYEDADGELHLHAEAMGKPWSNIVVDTRSIPDRAGVTSDEVIARLQRAFAIAGWTLIEAPGRAEG